MLRFQASPFDARRRSKATVSKVVGWIERKFGTCVFNRTARRLVVTDAVRRRVGPTFSLMCLDHHQRSPVSACAQWQPRRLVRSRLSSKHVMDSFAELMRSPGSCKSRASICGRKVRWTPFHERRLTMTLKAPTSAKHEVLTARRVTLLASVAALGAATLFAGPLGYWPSSLTSPAIAPKPPRNIPRALLTSSPRLSPP